MLQIIIILKYKELLLECKSIYLIELIVSSHVIRNYIFLNLPWYIHILKEYMYFKKKAAFLNPRTYWKDISTKHQWYVSPKNLVFPSVHKNSFTQGSQSKVFPTWNSAASQTVNNWKINCIIDLTRCHFKWYLSKMANTIVLTETKKLLKML